MSDKNNFIEINKETIEHSLIFFDTLPKKEQDNLVNIARDTRFRDNFLFILSNVYKNKKISSKAINTLIDILIQNPNFTKYISEFIVFNYSKLTKENKIKIENLVNNNEVIMYTVDSILSLYIPDNYLGYEVKINNELESFLIKLLNNKNLEHTVIEDFLVNGYYWNFSEKIRNILLQNDKYTSLIISELINTFSDDNIHVSLSYEDKIKLIKKLASRNSSVSGLIDSLVTKENIIPTNLKVLIISELNQKINIKYEYKDLHTSIITGFIKIVNNDKNLFSSDIKLSLIKFLDNKENINLYSNVFNNLHKKEKEFVLNELSDNKFSTIILTVLFNEYSGIDKNFKDILFENIIKDIKEQSVQNIQLISLITLENFEHISKNVIIKILNFFTNNEKYNYITPILLEENSQFISNNLLNKILLRYLLNLNSKIHEQSIQNNEDIDIEFFTFSIEDKEKPVLKFIEKIYSLKSFENEKVLEISIKNLDSLASNNKKTLLKLLNQKETIENYYPLFIKYINVLPSSYLYKILDLSKNKENLEIIINQILKNYQKQPEELKSLVLRYCKDNAYTKVYIDGIITNYENISPEIKNIFINFLKNPENHYNFLKILLDEEYNNFHNFRIKFLSEVIEKSNITPYLIWPLVNYNKEFSPSIKNKLTVLINNKDMLRYIAIALIYNFDNLDENININILSKIMESNDSDDILGIILLNNYEKIDSEIKKKIITHLFKNSIQNSLLITYIFTINFSTLNDNYKNKLIEFSKNKLTANNLAKALYYNLHYLPHEFSTQLLLNISKVYPFSNNLFKVLFKNYEDIDLKLKDILINTQIYPKLLFYNIFYYYSTLSPDLQKKFDIYLKSENVWEISKYISFVKHVYISNDKDLRIILSENKFFNKRFNEVIQSNSNLSAKIKRQLSDFKYFSEERFIVFLIFLEYYEKLPKSLIDYILDILLDSQRDDNSYIYDISGYIVKNFNYFDNKNKTLLLEISKKYNLYSLFWLNRTQVAPIYEEIINEYKKGYEYNIFNDINKLNIFDFNNLPIILRNELLIDTFPMFQSNIKESEHNNSSGYLFDSYFINLIDHNIN